MKKGLKGLITFHWCFKVRALSSLHHCHHTAVHKVLSHTFLCTYSCTYSTHVIAYILYCTVLYCTVLYCTVLYCTVRMCIA